MFVLRHTLNFTVIKDVIHKKKNPETLLPYDKKESDARNHFSSLYH